MSGLPWTREMENELIALTELPDNLSYVAIAERMSAKYEMEISKNACIGKARRLSVPQRNGKPHKPTGRPAKGVTKMVRIDAPILPTISCEGVDPLNGFPLETLTHNQCHFPLAAVMDRPPYVYCGAPTYRQTSWCDEHYNRVYTSPRRTWE